MADKALKDMTNEELEAEWAKASDELDVTRAESYLAFEEFSAIAAEMRRRAKK